MTCQDCGSKMNIEKTAHFAKMTLRTEQCPCGSRFETEEKVIRRLPATVRRRRATGEQPHTTVGPLPATGGGVGGAPSGDRISGSLSSTVSGSESVPPPLSASGSQGEDRAREYWNAHDWLEKFKGPWSVKYGSFYGQGTSDAKASGELNDAIDKLSEVDRRAAEARSGEMFAEYLADTSLGVVRARHPFAFFATRWNGLRVPVRAAVATAGHSQVTAGKDYTAGMNLFRKKGSQ